MPLYEEKFISPCAVRFSQARIRPTFQDGHVVEDTMQDIEAISFPDKNCREIDALLRVPFPPIEIIRWWPKMRDQDGIVMVDEEGSSVRGEACWFTFDNRRLYCLQAAAVKAWPRRVVAVVHVMRDLPISRGTPRKFRTTDMGNSVRIARRYDSVPRTIWNWAKATEPSSAAEELGLSAHAAIADHAAKESYGDLLDVPPDALLRSVPAALPIVDVNGGAADNVADAKTEAPVSQTRQRESSLAAEAATAAAGLSSVLVSQMAAKAVKAGHAAVSIKEMQTHFQAQHRAVAAEANLIAARGTGGGPPPAHGAGYVPYAAPPVWDAGGFYMAKQAAALALATQHAAMLQGQVPRNYAYGGQLPHKRPPGDPYGDPYGDPFARFVTESAMLLPVKGFNNAAPPLATLDATAPTHEQPSLIGGVRGDWDLFSAGDGSEEVDADCTVD
jgi:hypothetical protein